jgi:hypothetical protein
LVAHGADPYKHDPKQKESYFVTLDIGGKEITRWGVDFKRAFAEFQSPPKAWDTVVLSNTAKQNVDIVATACSMTTATVADKKNGNEKRLASRKGKLSRFVTRPSRCVTYG